MIEIETVLVLGAGASVPFGFPTGQELKAKICSKSSDVNTNLNNLREIGFNRGDIEKFRVALLRSGRSSVDAFLEYRDDFVPIGKAAIASTLLTLKRTGSMFDSHVKGNWYEYLFGILSDGISFDEFDKNNLSIITFNYDRSFEHYLFTALINSYNKGDKDCAEILGKIRIIHVHGHLGDLEWQTSTSSSPPVPYDSNGRSDHIQSAAQNIKIIPESEMDTDEFIQARELIARAKHLLFLGFDYHPTNLRRLVPENIKPTNNVKGTMLGLRACVRSLITQV